MKITVNRLDDAGGPLRRRLRDRLAVAARLLSGEHPLAGGEVAIILADDRYLQKLNSRFRGLDAPTDVLSFSMQEPGGGDGSTEGETGAVMLGDIYISLDRAVDQAAAAGHSLEREVLILALHGFLHLLGYDHEEGVAAEAMERQERRLLERIEELAGGTGPWERLIHSFRDAFAGLGYCLATQRNMAIHLAAGVIVLVLAFLLHLEGWKLFLILTAIFAVLIAEAINTAIEKTVDLVTQERHRLAHIAKDVAAGAVLLTALYALLVGALILGPPLWEALLKLIHS